MAHEIPANPLGVCGRYHLGLPDSEDDVGRRQQWLGQAWVHGWLEQGRAATSARRGRTGARLTGGVRVSAAQRGCRGEGAGGVLGWSVVSVVWAMRRASGLGRNVRAGGVQGWQAKALRGLGRVKRSRAGLGGCANRPD